MVDTIFGADLGAAQEGADRTVTFFASLAPNIREKIFSAKKGQARVTELFRQVQRKIIPRYAITLLGQQDDPMKRARDARKTLKKEGIQVLSGRYQRKQMAKYGFPDAGPQDWLSVSRA